MTPLLSIVIPGYNRVEPLKYTLRSAAAAARRLPADTVEILLVDDGSTPPLAEQLTGFDPGHPVRHLRQTNQGSIVARLTGLTSAQGERVLFLDSDDLIAPDKLTRHLDTVRETDADITYDDLATATLGPDYTATYTETSVLSVATNSADFFLKVQPAPHSPIYRRSFLARCLAHPMVAHERRMDPAGDVWFYYNLAPYEARVVKINAPLTAIVPHEEIRFSLHWEKLGAAALLVAEAFQRSCPANPSTLAARRAVGEIAFGSWRRLPYDFHAGYTRRLLTVWRRAPRGPLSALGGTSFTSLSRLLGPVAAGFILRRLRGNPYSHSRTLTDEQLSHLLDGFANDR